MNTAFFQRSKSQRGPWSKLLMSH